MREIRGGRRLGVYRVEAVLGEGGMGEVFLAWDERLERHVAIKRIRAELQRDERHRERFRREARAAARLNHPAIVQVFDLLEDEDGDCLVMERALGRTLTEALARGEVETELALRLAAQVAGGLAAAHAEGLVHRDLKTQNVMVTPAGDAKILDFGLARALWSPEGRGVERVSAALTEAGTLVGTVHAMSPEQAGGRPADHRSDLFALGGLLYEMLTGRAPFRGDNWLDTLRRVTGERPEPLALLRPDLPAGVARLVAHLLDKDPERRPQNARVVADELERLRADLDTSPPSDEAAETAETTETKREAPLRRDESGPLEDLPTGEWVSPESALPEGEVGVETAVRTLLLVEIVDRPALFRQRDETAAAKLLARCDETLRQLMARHGGAEAWKSNELGALFERPVDAVACALAYHRALLEITGGAGVPLEARAAVHLGEVQLRRPGADGVSRGAPPLEVEGLAKVTASRLLTIAGPRQTLSTRGAFDLARRAVEQADGVSPRQVGPRWLAHGAYLFDDGEESLEIFEAGVDGLAPLAPPPGGLNARRALSPSELKMLGWRPATGQEVPRRPHWTLQERLGEGGFGEVWLARHKSGERRVFKFCFEAERLRALKREVTLFRLLKEALGHRDDIARILDWHFDDAPFFVESEYTEGGDLVEWAEHEGGLDAVPLGLRLELVAEVAEALAAAHSVGILHKDVKPENVLITRDREGRPRARLTDFGIGLLTERERLENPGFTALGFTETTTPTDSGAGTLGYLAPELVEGRAATVQADVYSLGVLLYQLAVADFTRILAPGWERDVDDEMLVEDIAFFTDGQPAKRPASAREVAERLRTLEDRRRERREEEARRRALDRAQRRRRLATVTAAVSLVVLAIVAVMAVRENRARRDAEAARERASLRQEQAEGLIGFMLGDLREKLDSVGRLDVLDSVGEQAMDYFAAVPAAQLSDLELARRSQALYQIGEVRIEQGRLAEAVAPLADSLTLAQELHRRRPEDLQRLFDLGQSHFWVGFAHWKTGDFERAEGHFESYREISRELVAQAPMEPGYQLELAYADSNLGSLAESRGDLRTALREFARSLAINEALVDSDPSNRRWRFELAATHSLMGATAQALGDREAAGEHFETEAELLTTLVAEDPAHWTWKDFLGTSHDSLGGVLIEEGDWSGALQQFKASHEIFSTLTQHDPGNSTWQGKLATSLWRIGVAEYAAGHDEEALEAWRRQREIHSTLVEQDPLDPEWRRGLVIADVKIATAMRRLGLPGVRDRLRLATTTLEALADDNPQDWRAVLGLAEAHALSGALEDDQGHEEAARHAWLKAARVLRPLMEGDFDTHEIRHLWRQVSDRLGAAAEGPPGSPSLQAEIQPEQQRSRDHGPQANS